MHGRTCVAALLWSYVVVCGLVWSCVVLCGLVWSCVVVCGRVWFCVCVCAFICVRVFICVCPGPASSRMRVAPPLSPPLSHLDVVHADPSKWERDPFKLSVEGDKLYGRGTTGEAACPCFLFS